MLSYASQGSCKRLGLLMPLYPATLQHLPDLADDDALVVGTQVLSALSYMHDAGLGHCDVKAPNIFLDADGSAHLGDYGSTRRLGEDADEKTASHVPVDANENGLDVDKASAALDRLLLAVTLLERLKLIQLHPQRLCMQMVHEGIQGAKTEVLRSFLQSLLP